MATYRAHDRELRARLLARTGQIVTADGLSGLSLRQLAAAEDTSTTAIYSLFGGKPGLVTALFVDAFESFADSQRSAPHTGEWFSDMDELAEAYWQWAMANPHLYQVMFGSALAGVELDPALVAASFQSLEPLATLISAGVESKILQGDAELITLSVWSAVHGAVTLALSLGAVMPPGRASQKDIYEATIHSIVRGWQTA